MSRLLTEYDVRVSPASRWDRLLFRLEHRLLSPGTSELGQLRGYLRVKSWRDLTSVRQRLGATAAAVKLPARALRGAWRALDKHGPVADAAGVSRARQLRELWWIWMRYGTEPSVYYCFGLYRPGQLGRASGFMQAMEGDRIYRLLNARTALDEAELLLDKGRFERWLVERGFPTTRTVMEFDQGAIVRSGSPDGGLPRCDLFSKPNDSMQGFDTSVWPFDGEGWTGADGHRRTEAELIAELTELSRTQGLIVQARLRNHPALAPIAPGALSTIRVLTLRDLDGTIRPIVAVAKIPTGTAPTDHMRLGGLAAPVDLATGRLGAAIAKDDLRIVVPCERHPDTGTTIAGFQLPEWEGVLALAIGVHSALERIVCVGWDIAILPDGPVLIEGNDNPGHSSVQLPTGRSLGETPVLGVVLARLRASFG